MYCWVFVLNFVVWLVLYVFNLVTLCLCRIDAMCGCSVKVRLGCLGLGKWVDCVVGGCPLVLLGFSVFVVGWSGVVWGIGVHLLDFLWLLTFGLALKLGFAGWFKLRVSGLVEG